MDARSTTRLPLDFAPRPTRSALYTPPLRIATPAASFVVASHDVTARLPVIGGAS